MVPNAVEQLYAGWHLPNAVEQLYAGWGLEVDQVSVEGERPGCERNVQRAFLTHHIEHLHRRNRRQQMMSAKDCTTQSSMQISMAIYYSSDLISTSSRNAT